MHQIANFHEVSSSFLDHDIVFSPAELHGFLTGHLCLNPRIDREQWLCCAWKFLGITNPPAYIIQVVSDWREFIKHQLNSSDFIFSPYILDDDEDVEEKLLAVAQWCQGYVVGVANYGQELQLNLTKEVKELILDLTKISQVETKDDLLSVEEKESSYMEILEYVRMGVIYVRDEYHLNKDPNMSRQQTNDD
jgi:yecA family protein